MKPVILKVAGKYDDTVEMAHGSFTLTFSKRSPSVDSKDKFVVGEEYKLSIEKVSKTGGNGKKKKK